MKRTAGTIALFIAISMLIGLLAGCSTGTPASTTVDPAKPVVLRLATGGTDAIKVMNEIAAGYAKTNPTVSMEITVLPGGVAGFNAAMASKFAASDAPDLFTYQWGTQVTAYARAGHLMDLTGSGIKATLKDIKKPVNVFEGKDYAYPLVQMLWGLMYNTEIGKKAGVTEIPKTIAQFTAAMDKIKANGQEYPFIVPAKDGSGATGFVFCYLHQVVSGQNPDFYYQTLKGEKSWNGPEWKGLFDTYEKLLKYASPDKLGLDPDNALARFARGEGTFLVTGPSTVKRIEGMNPDLKGKIQYIPFPLYTNEADYGTIADYDSAFSIWAKTKYPEHAMGMYKAFYTPANSVAYCTVMNAVSPVKGTPNTNLDPSIVNQVPLLEAGKFVGFSEREWIPGVKEIMKKVVQDWMAGTIDTATAMSNLEKEHKRLLDATPTFITDFETIRKNTTK